jgi:hypothetical protein
LLLAACHIGQLRQFADVPGRQDEPTGDSERQMNPHTPTVGGQRVNNIRQLTDS